MPTRVLPESRLLIAVLHYGPGQYYLPLLVHGEACRELGVCVCITRALHSWLLLVMLCVQGDGSQHFDCCGILLKLAEQVSEEHGTRDGKLLLRRA